MASAAHTASLALTGRGIHIRNHLRLVRGGAMP